MDQLVRLDDRRSGLGPPRFRLGTLLLIVTALCIVLASYRWIGPYGAMMIGVFVIAILAHIAGNWLGTQLREIGDRPAPDEDAENLPVTHGLAKGTGNVQPQHFAPVTHLRGRAPLTRAVLIAVVSAFAAGAAGGALVVWFFSPTSPTWAMFICGATAFGVLAAIWAFLVAAFVQSGWKALSQATKGK